MFVLVTASMPGQNVNPMHPEEIQAQKHASPDDMRSRAANVQLQKDAEELKALCTSVTSDMEGVKKGMLAQSALDNLKRMEKLSKRVRDQLGRVPAGQ